MPIVRKQISGAKAEQLEQKLVETINKKLGSSNGIMDKILFNTQKDVVLEFTNFPKPPIKTGQLRQSIRVKRTGFLSGQVIANKDYAVHVEFGTIRMQPRPFMRNGVAKAMPENLKILLEGLRDLGKI